MNRLMMNTMGYPLLDEAGDGAGGGAPAADTATAAQETEQTAGEGNDTTETAEAPTGDPKPFLGDPATAKTEEGGKTEESKPATEEDYAKAMVKDGNLLGDDKSVQFDPDLVKAMIPEAQKIGVPPDKMGALANAFAKAQMEQAKEQLKQRIDYFNKMKDESLRKYSPNDFAQINQGIDHWFKPNGVMNNVIRNSELGADPEFLALMHYLGSKRVMDDLSGANAGGGSSVDPNSTEGLSKMW